MEDRKVLKCPRCGMMIYTEAKTRNCAKCGQPMDFVCLESEYKKGGKD